MARPAPIARSRRARQAPFQAPLFAIECLETEAALRHAGYQAIAGVDEVGRGCWAGPVYAAAVVLPASCYADRTLLGEVTDSKLLSPAKRERLAADVARLATGAAIAWVEPPLIDQVNILGATRLAMQAAVRCLGGAPQVQGPCWGALRLAGAPTTPDFLLTDAVALPEIALPQQAVVRGDRSCLSVAAASIVAKVARDAEMCRRAGLFPHLALAANKGYGTRTHVLALHRSGVTPLHRRSFAPMKYLLGLRDHVAGALPPPPMP
ncbi:MAG: ribonuclease HII, partial [Chloroflexota bacterium]